MRNSKPEKIEIPHAVLIGRRTESSEVEFCRTAVDLFVKDIVGMSTTIQGNDGLGHSERASAHNMILTVLKKRYI